MNRFLEIDALRALACFIIVIDHTAASFSNLTGANTDGMTLHNFFWSVDLGRSAVTIFFAISGYVIASTISGAKSSGSFVFWGRRIFRLYPVFWLSNLAAVIFIFLPFDLVDGKQLLANMTMIPKVLGYENLVGVYWTLETDLAFYFLAWVIFVLGYHNKPQILFLFCLGLVVLTFIFALNRDYAPSYHYWLAMPYHISIMFWAAIYRIFCDTPKKIIRLGLFSLSAKGLFLLTTAIVLLPSLLALLLYFTNDDPLALRNAATYSLGMLAFVVFTRWLPLRNKFLAKIGDYTYAIYLFHAIILASLINVINHYSLGIVSWPIGVWIIVIFGASVVVGHMVFNYVEKPMMHIGRRLFHNKKTNGASSNSPNYSEAVN